ncbi:prostaglandin E2 receptor EP1 subtype-like [Discoglossus pictus]
MYPFLQSNSTLSSLLSPLPPSSPSYPPSASSSPSSSASPLIPSVSMTLGASSNALGLWILARDYANSHRLRRSRVQFLLLASGLLLTDLAGHLIPGSIVLWAYAKGELSKVACHFLGGCMVFFGLSPLLLGLLMASERCLALTRPLWHLTVVTQTRARLGLALAWIMALLVSILPLLGYGAYDLQPSKTWCFLSGPTGFRLLFSGLGLGSLGAALVFNVLCGVTLLRARLLGSVGEKRRRRRGARSRDIEMVVQLLAITLVSCICWSPLLVSVMMLHTEVPPPRPDWLLFGVRLASYNQILDPWVYILLRCSVLHRLCIFIQATCSCTGKLSRWDPGDFQSSDRSEVTRL